MSTEPHRRENVPLLSDGPNAASGKVATALLSATCSSVSDSG
jgi:hypothetical protein